MIFVSGLHHWAVQFPKRCIAIFFHFIYIPAEGNSSIKWCTLPLTLRHTKLRDSLSPELWSIFRQCYSLFKAPLVHIISDNIRYNNPCIYIYKISAERRVWRRRGGAPSRGRTSPTSRCCGAWPGRTCPPPSSPPPTPTTWPGDYTSAVHCTQLIG